MKTILTELEKLASQEEFDEDFPAKTGKDFEDLMQRCIEDEDEPIWGILKQIYLSLDQSKDWYYLNNYNDSDEGEIFCPDLENAEKYAKEFFLTKEQAVKYWVEKANEWKEDEEDAEEDYKKYLRLIAGFPGLNPAMENKITEKWFVCPLCEHEDILESFERSADPKYHPQLFLLRGML